MSALLLAAVQTVEAGVYNLHLATDNVPDLTDIDSFVLSVTGPWESPQDKCIAVWRWGRRLRRQTSCATEGGRLIWDPILHYNSYGAMNCGIISSLNIASWLRLGYRARYIQLGDHTVSEVSWDKGKTWHLFDSSMSIFCFNHEGSVASCKEVQEALGCELSRGKVEPGHYYLYHYFPPCGTHPGPTGWRCAADQPVGYERTLANGASSYTDGFSISQYCQYARFGHRYILNLRPHESYTRYWHPLDDARGGGNSGTNDRDYFRPLPDGSDPDDQHGLNDLRGNGVWIFEPDLRGEDLPALLHDYRAVEPGKTGWMVFKVSAANAITSIEIQGVGRRGAEEDSLRMLVSRDAGVRWMPVWNMESAGTEEIRVRLRDEVAGHTECLVKLEMGAARRAEDVGLDALRITTITQLNRRALPCLTLGTNRVLLRADEPVDTTTLWPALHGGAFRETVFEAHKVSSDEKPDGVYKATLGAGENGDPCHAVWRVETPTDIASVTYGVVVTNRSPNSSVSLLHSWDGERFTEFFRKADGDEPFDLQVLHTIPGDQVPRGARTAFVKCLFFAKEDAATYNMPGIQDLLVRAQHEPRDARFQSVEVTYNWTEHRKSGDVVRSHTEVVGALPHEYTIEVGGYRDPTMNWVRMNLQGYASRGEKTASQYSDGADAGTGHEPRRVRFDWGTNLALGKPYLSGRPASAGSGNPDTDGVELTNGIVIAPTDSVASGAVQAATAFWDAGEPVAFTVDLGDVVSPAGVRVATHQPNERYCHPERVEVAVSPDGALWHPAGVLRHDDLWSPPGDYEPWEHDDDPDYARLPGAGRLAYSFPLAFEKPMEGRFVRFTCYAQEGRGMGISELQVFDRVTTSPWPGDVWLPDRTAKGAGPR